MSTLPGDEVTKSLPDRVEDAVVQRELQPQAPSHFGRFQLVKMIGAGSYATVWQARDGLLDRLVALKIPHQAPRTVEERDAVLNEARAVARLRHPSIVQIFDVGETEATIYIATECIEGPSLREQLRERRLTSREAATLCVRMADALQHAHSSGIVHRDLKPANVLINRDGSPVITDFGLARFDLQDTPLDSQSSHIAGTLGYMAPEQARGDLRSTDARADIYALGVILFEMLTGERPFRGDVEAMRQAILQEAPRRPRSLSAETPRDLEAICLKCLEKAPERRYGTADDLAADLRRFLDGQPVRAYPLSLPRRLWRWCHRQPALAALTLIAFAMVGLVLAQGIVNYLRTLDLLESARTHLYFHRVVAAQQSWLANDMSRFRDLLEDCPQDLRKWEWGYLRGLSDVSRLSLMRAGSCVAYSPDGATIATAGANRSVRLWNADSGQTTARLIGHAGYIVHVAFDRNGTKLASAGGEDKTVLIWDVREQRKLSVMRGHTDSITGICFCDGGRQLVSASLDGNACIWDVQTGKLLHRLSHTGRIWSLDVSSDDQWIATTSGRDSDSFVQLWNARTAELVWRIDGPRTRAAAAFHPDSTRLAFSGESSNVSIIDIHSHRALLKIATSTGSPPFLAFSPDGTRIAANQWNQMVRIWDTVDGEELHAVRGSTSPIRRISFRPNSTEFAFGTARETVIVCAPGTSANTSVLNGHRNQVTALAFSDSGDVLASSGMDGELRLWNADGTPRSQLGESLTAPIRCIAWKPDGRFLVAGGDDTVVRIWDTVTCKCVFEFRRHTRAVQAVSVSSDGSLVATAGRDRSVMVWRSSDGYVLHRLPVDDRDVRSLAFSRDGRRLAVAGRSTTVQLWRLESEQVESSYDCKYPTYDVQFHPGGDELAIAASDGSFRLWNPRSGHCEIRESCDADRRRANACYGSDGTRLVTSVANDSVRLWDPRYHRSLLTLEEGTNVTGVVRFSPCGRHIAAAHSDGTIVIWRSSARADRKDSPLAQASDSHRNRVVSR